MKVVFILIIACLTPFAFCQDISASLEKCCEMGNKEQISCNQIPPIPADIPRTHHTVCQTVFGLCCTDNFRSRQCQHGKTAALVGNSCVVPPVTGGEYYKDCCDGCNLGLQMATIDPSCTHSFEFQESLWTAAFQECCMSSTENQVPENQTLKGSLCQTRNPCSQLCEDTGLDVRCSCLAGYDLAENKHDCIDIDECSAKTDTCHPETETCVNTIGSFSCGARMIACPSGFAYSEEIKSCIDIDECENPLLSKCDSITEICLNLPGSFHCQGKYDSRCPAGYKWHRGQRQCKDVDECDEKLHSCDVVQEECRNTVGGYECDPKCPNGFYLNSRTQNCEDIDECSQNTHNCNSNESCVNTEGGHTCRGSTGPASCGIGFVYDLRARRCQDINECDISNNCKEEQQCINTPGSYTCTCPTGYNFNPLTLECQDVNECQVGLHSCHSLQRCDNTVGSYFCTRVTGCGTGYTLNFETARCEDNDECTLGSHNCAPGYACRNTEGSFRCDRVICLSGQKQLPDGTCLPIVCPRGMHVDSSGQCVDINECEQPNICQRHERCVNTQGSYVCRSIITCSPGYEWNGIKCADVDECSRRLHTCGFNQKCINMAGGHACKCFEGYRATPNNTCEDVDECAMFAGQICSNCQNTIGSYICDCDKGFKQVTSLDGGKRCVDVDECSEVPTLCDHNCNNMYGSYQCTCRRGYMLSADGRTCTDVDECKLSEGRGVLCIGECLNTPGSYQCNCPEGYELSPNKVTCNDIDECKQKNTCNENEMCLNTRGGYKCNTFDCPPGYVKDSQYSNRCKLEMKQCLPGNLECMKQPQAYSFNYITLTSNIPIPSSGQLKLFTLRGPRSPDTKVDVALNFINTRSLDGTAPASAQNFYLNNLGPNEAMLSLIKTIPGPQEIELDLNMNIFLRNRFAGKSVAKLYIIVSKYAY